jgi:hypothetical protein
MENIVSDKLIDFTRKLLQKQGNTGLYFGVRFYSNELVKKEIAKGNTVMQSLRTLAKLDYENL